jgi:pimeloyl-ACP methyl ester carboxylesterase
MTVFPEAQFARAEQRAVAKTTQFEGGHVAYWYYPAAGRSKGDIVFVHGFRGAHDGLHAIIAQLEDYDCYAPDIPGFGLTEPAKTEHGLETYSRFLGSFISGLKLKAKPTVVGHSFGSLIVARHAFEAKGDIDRVVLINPVSKPGLEGPRRVISLGTSLVLKFAKLLPERGSRFIVDSWPVIRFVSATMYKGHDKAIRRWVHKQHHATMVRYANKNVLFESYQASITESVEKYAAGIKNRTLLIWGEFDDITSLEQQREVFEQWSNAEYDLIEGVGHLTHYEASDKVAKMIHDFLATASK